MVDVKSGELGASTAVSPQPQEKGQRTLERAEGP